MKKTHITVIALLLLVLLACSTAQSVFAAHVGSAVFCPNNFSEEAGDTWSEIGISTAYCTWIHDMIDAKYLGYNFLSIDSSVNDYVAYLQILKGYDDKTIVFSKGHRGIWIPYTAHISLIAHNGDNVEDANHIYYNTDYYKNTFTFIWHCETSEYYYLPNSDQYGAFGMPYCFTHNHYMQQYGTSGSHVFLGWIDKSPQFETWVNANYRFASVAYWFWYYVCQGYSVGWALNYLCNKIYGCPYFVGTTLYTGDGDHGPLTVWGNRYMCLPSE